MGFFIISYYNNNAREMHWAEKNEMVGAWSSWVALPPGATDCHVKRGRAPAAGPPLRLRLEMHFHGAIACRSELYRRERRRQWSAKGLSADNDQLSKCNSLPIPSR